MTDHADDGGHTAHDSEYATERTTAPQSAYTMKDVTVGTLVALIGVLVVFGIPLALTL
ncbi:DUF7550 family protein [Natronomonas sp. EA1]|uniref:DUF7550 family protein n=1 Tax=Natronomonas sp. EA1 TaxID=3421655 RepID=UPI003EB6DBCC